MSTALRQKMHQDLQLAGLSEGTQDVYLRAVRQLAVHFHTRATASKIPVILAVLDGNLVCSYNVYYWHIFNNHPNYGCKSLEYSQNFRSITVSGLSYLMKNPHFDAVALTSIRSTITSVTPTVPSTWRVVRPGLLSWKTQVVTEFLPGTI